MARKRKSTDRSKATNTGGDGGGGIGNGKSEVLKIGTWEDVADPEDEFHISRDKVLLEGDDGGGGGRGDYSASDEEILALSPSSSSSDSEEDEEDDEEDDEEEGWGKSRRAYYSHQGANPDEDDDEDDDDGAAEESEALRQQAKHLSTLSASDYVFDPTTWLSPPSPLPPPTTSAARHVESLPAPTASMSTREKERLLKMRHPEFPALAREFAELEPLHAGLCLSAAAAEAVGETEGSSVAVAKFRALSAYLGVLSLYFAVLTSERGGGGGGEVGGVKEHGVMEGLVRCRDIWNRVKNLEVEELGSGRKGGAGRKNKKQKKTSPSGDLRTVETTATTTSTTTTAPPARVKVRDTRQAPQSQAKPIEDDLSSLSALISLTKTKTKTKPKPPAQTTPSTSDFQEPPHLPASLSTEKSRARHNLRFYTSQITSKSAARHSASLLAGGDTDIPHRDRKREAAKRKRDQVDDDDGIDLDTKDPTPQDVAVAKRAREEDEDEYSRILSTSSKDRKKAKKEAHEAAKEARKVEMDVEQEEGGGGGGKRAIGYVIAKNKGLTPHRKKDVRNPRVKKRNKYEAAKKKLASTKPVWKGGLKGAYGGETTGIKKNLVKSVKFAA